MKDFPDATDLRMADDDVAKGKVGDVRFEKVSFRYQRKDGCSGAGLRNVSLHVRAGKMLAIVGASGKLHTGFWFCWLLLWRITNEATGVFYLI